MKTRANCSPIRRALVSTYDKTGLVSLCENLVKAGVEIISTGNTCSYLKSHNIEVTSIEEITNFPEILGGRVKTLHPNLFAGILARRNLASDMETLTLQEIDTIDLVVVNLYPFERTIAMPGATQSDCIENIDVGGPSLLRASAKNFEHVTVLCDPSQYESFLTTFNTSLGTSLQERASLANLAFQKTAQYDLAIASWMGAKPLRYGENPHQKSKVLYSSSSEIPLAQTAPIHGKELSYNNLLDAHAAILSLRCLFNEPKKDEVACVLIKHGTPCGAAVAQNTSEATRKAIESDPTSSFGGILAISTKIDEQAAQLLKTRFLEVIIAPDFSNEALSLLTEKPDLRLLKISTIFSSQFPKESLRSIFGGILIQETDQPHAANERFDVVSAKSPSLEESADLKIAMALALPCLSNAVTIVRNGQLIGVGAGQTSRVEAVKIAISKAKENGHNLSGSVLASDGFFPFPDSLVIAHEAGIRSIIQPGGSKKDGLVVEKANELELAMVMTSVRHFRH